MTEFLTQTPQEILEETAVDVFTESIGSLPGDADVVDALTNDAWDRYGNRMIGDYDYQRWLGELSSQVRLSWRWYQRISRRILEDLDDVETSSYTETVTETEDVDETVDNTDTETVETQSEEMPDVPVGLLEYLDNRGKTDRSTDTLGELNRDRTLASERAGSRADGLGAESMQKVASSLRDLNSMFLDDLEPLFVNRW